MIKKLRVKFVAILMLVVACLLGVSFGLFYTLTRQNLRTQSISMMQAIAANPLEPVLPDAQPQQVRLPYFVLQMDKYGMITAINSGSFDLSDYAFLERIAQTALAGSETTGEIPEYNLRFCRVTASGVQSVIFADTTSERQTLRSLARTGAGIGAVSLLAFFGLALLLARWAIRPVEAAWEQQKQFVADASHELKTPLTVILSNAELLEGAGLAEKPARWSGNIHTEAEQMRTLVEQMLTLARADNGVRPAAMEPLNLSDVATDCVLAFEPVAFEAGKPLEERITADITVVGDADRLRRLISILLDNAVKYGAEGGHITLTLEKTDRQARLTVSNPGDPIPPEHLAHLFERFYRADASRGEKSGFGLGLAIADTIAREHKGVLKAESDTASTRFTFTMPLKK